MVRHNTTRHDTARHGTIHHGTTRHDTARHGTTRHDTTYKTALNWIWIAMALFSMIQNCSEIVLDRIEIVPWLDCRIQVNLIDLSELGYFLSLEWTGEEWDTLHCSSGLPAPDHKRILENDLWRELSYNCHAYEWSWTWKSEWFILFKNYDMKFPFFYI